MRISSFGFKRGVVRVMHREVGREWSSPKPAGAGALEKFIHTPDRWQLGGSSTLVEPEVSTGGGILMGLKYDKPYDPLLDLFRNKAELATEPFLTELRKQRHSDHDSVQSGIPLDV
jgi:hypothetical protein